jgi:glyceraldehyde 3-phosphate dehydrogenase
MTAEQLAYLLKYDTVYGTWGRGVNALTDGNIEVDGNIIQFTHIDFYDKSSWSDCNWSDVSAQNVFDCMGIDRLETSAIMQTHIDGGAKNVFCCGGAMANDMTSIIFGITHRNVDPSSTRIVGIFNGDVQAAAVIGKLLDDSYTLEEAICENICSYTNLNNLEDSALRGYVNAPQVGRAGAWNIIPVKSSFAKKVGLVSPQINGKLNGRELRAGTIAGAFMNITANLKDSFDADTFYASLKTTLADTLATAYTNNAMCGKYVEDYLSVSSDAIGEPCVIMNTRDSVALTPNLVNVQGLYDALSLQAGNAILVATYWNE